mgnify:CR=1 FL=1
MPTSYTLTDKLCSICDFDSRRLLKAWKDCITFLYHKVYNGGKLIMLGKVYILDLYMDPEN